LTVAAFPVMTGVAHRPPGNPDVKSLLALCLLSIAASLALPSEAQTQLAYTARDAHLRAGPAREYPVVAILPAGLAVSVQGCLSDYSWCDVIAGPSRGWVYAGNIDYAYDGMYVPLLTYGPQIGIGVTGFILFDYWSDHYHDRPWYRDRDRWDRDRRGWNARPHPEPQRPASPDGRPRHPPERDRPGEPHDRPYQQDRPDAARPPPHPQDRPGVPDRQPPQRDRPDVPRLQQPQREHSGPPRAQPPQPGRGDAPRPQPGQRDRPGGQAPAQRAPGGPGPSPNPRPN